MSLGRPDWLSPGIILGLIFIVMGTVRAQEIEAGAEYKVSVETVNSNGAYHINGVNKNPYSVTLTIDISGNNYKLNTRLPLTKVIQPNSTRHLLTLYADDEEKGFKFETSYGWVMGDTKARHDDSYLYRLPFKSGETYRIGQTYNGSFSHKGNIRYSVDFMMPTDTEVRAARGGRVVQLYEDSDVGGEAEEYKDKSNYVVIEHEDGTFGDYAHLSKNGVLVNIGQRIHEGQLIALSGNTGYSSGPHLHFMVVKVREDGTNVTIPVRFKTKSGVVTLFEEGKTYTAN